MKVLVTGGAGFIGSHLCQKLIKKGIQTVVLDNLSVGKKENISPDSEFVKGDIQDLDLVKKVVGGVEAVYHLAANVTIRGSVDKFYEDAQTNIMGTLNLLRACKGSPVKKFIFSSSMAVYADSPDPTPISENWAKEPISPYGIAKLASERYVLVAGKQMGISPTVLRFFNIYGPNQTYTPYVGVITIFINRLLANQSLSIFGDGEQKRDFVYVGDIAEAASRVLESEAAGQIMNVGTGKPTSVNQIANLLIKKIRPEVKPDYQEAHPGELRYSIADPSLLEKITSFKPQTRLEDKIDEVIEEIKKQK